MKKIPYKDHSHIGHCVYKLINRNKIVYVGYTFNLGKRLGEHIQSMPFITDSKRNKRLMPDERGLCKKEFTHYSYISSNNEKRARLLEKILIKKHNPIYNNHRDYQWVDSDKKYIMYKLWTRFDRKNYGRKSDGVQPVIYTKMIWKKKTSNNADKNIIQYKNKDGNIVTYNKSKNLSVCWYMEETHDS